MKIISQNFCLGLPNKIDQARLWTKKLNPDIFIIQEAEITRTTDIKLLNIKSYSLHHTKANDNRKARLAVYIKEKLEAKVTIAENAEMILIKAPEVVIFAIYRPFKHIISKSADNIAQLEFIETNFAQDVGTIIIGDTNLDWNKRHNTGYAHYKALQTWLEHLNSLGFRQTIKEPTWSRTVKGDLKTSILDHIYVTNIESFIVKVEDLLISDHQAIEISLPDKKTHQKIKATPAFMRCWKRYTPENLCASLAGKDFGRLEGLDVDDHCFDLNQMLMAALDTIAPEKLIHPDERPYIWSEKLIKIRRKKSNLIKKQRKLKTNRFADKIKQLNKDFRRELLNENKKKINNTVINHRGDQKSFWKAVKIATGVFETNSGLPPSMEYKGSIAKTNKQKSEMFAQFFEEKANQTGSIKTGVFNGNKKFIIPGKHSITKDEIRKVLLELKPKTCFGYDRVPLRILKDVATLIIDTIYSLFCKITENKKIPELWRISRIIPIHKKGPKDTPENYRPISNLCSLAKVYERCLLNNLKAMADENGVDLTGSNQYGFKKNCSTISLCLQLQKKNN
jgi:hypothetical protein